MSAPINPDMQKKIATQSFYQCVRDKCYKDGKADRVKLDAAISKIAQKNNVALNPADYPQIRQGVESKKSQITPLLSGIGAGISNVLKGAGGAK